MKAYQVITNSKTIDKLHHGLTFASDALVNARLKQKYGLYTYLTHCDELNLTMLQDTADKWSNYTNELIKTVGWTSSMTVLDYDPISNYDRHEEEDTNRDIAFNNKAESNATQTPENWETTISNSGFNSNEMTDVEKSKQSGIYKSDSETENTGKQDDDTHRKLYVHGNIGVMSTQQMIQQERDLIIDVLDFYIEKFKECFNLRLESLGGHIYEQ